MRSPIGLGDLLRAWNAAGRDPELLAPLARALALGPDQATATPLPSESVNALPRLAFAQPVVSKTHDLHPRSDHATRATVALEPLSSVPPPEPAWMASSPLPRATKERPALVPPLFQPERERALLAAVARRLRADGDIDVEGLVRAMARLDLPRPLPRRFVPSLGGGVQIVIDRSSWMAPFHADTARLVDRFRAVVGDALEELWVPDLPPDVVTPTDETVRPWAPPMAGTALIVVSDLGRAALRQRRRQPRSEWLAFLQRIHATGFDPIAIVPGRKASYLEADKALREVLLLGWDRSARVAEVARFRKGMSR